MCFMHATATQVFKKWEVELLKKAAFGDEPARDAAEQKKKGDNTGPIVETKSRAGS